MDREDAFQVVTEYWGLVEKVNRQPLLSGDHRAVMRDVKQS